MTADRTETNDLAQRRPDVVTKMAALYNEWAARVGVAPWETGQ